MIVNLNNLELVLNLNFSNDNHVYKEKLLFKSQYEYTNTPI